MEKPKEAAPAPWTKGPCPDQNCDNGTDRRGWPELEPVPRCACGAECRRCAEKRAALLVTHRRPPACPTCHGFRYPTTQHERDEVRAHLVMQEQRLREDRPLTVAEYEADQRFIAMLGARRKERLGE